MPSSHLPRPQIAAVFFRHASLFASLLLLTAATFPVTAEEISESWEVAKLHTRSSTEENQTGSQEITVTNAEEVLRDDIPGGKRAFKLPRGNFIRFNPIAIKNEPRNLSLAKIIKLWVYSESQAKITVRIAGRLLKMQEHLGGGWQLIQYNLESDFQEQAIALNQEKRQNILTRVTLIDVVASLDKIGGDVVLISGLSAE